MIDNLFRFTADCMQQWTPTKSLFYLEPRPACDGWYLFTQRVVDHLLHGCDMPEIVMGKYLVNGIEQIANGTIYLDLGPLQPTVTHL